MPTIRLITTPDIPAVSELLCACYKYVVETENLPEQFLEFLISERGSIETVTKESQIEEYYVAMDDNKSDKLTGMISFKDDMITKLYVHPDYHGRGIGRKLFELAVSKIKEAGFKSVGAYLLTPSAIPFYESVGMKIVERGKASFEMYPGSERIKMEMKL